MRSAALLVILACASCAFVDDVPRDAAVRCAKNADCPSGAQCNVARFQCVAGGSDITPPVIASIAFDPPAVSTGSAKLIVTANEALANKAPLVAAAAGSADLPYVFAGVNGAVATLDVDTAGLAEGVYAVGRVAVFDVAGNEGDANAVNVSLVVDRTAPELVDLALVDVPANGLSDVAPNNVLKVQFIASEPLAAAAVSLGPLTSACDVVDASSLSESCALTITPGAVPDGANQIVVDASDLAGNTVQRSLPANVDTAAPAIVDGTVSLALRAPDGTPSTSVGAGGFVEVSFVVSEPLAATPLIQVGSGTDSFALTSGGASGTLVTMSGFVPSTIAPGAYPVTTTLKDAVGHVANLAVPLPAPFQSGVPITAATSSSCPAPGVGCVDADGDGFFAIDPHCPGGNDCNDLDPTIFPNAPEIPGDGAANDCSQNGDVAIADDTGVFVDCSGTGGAQDGTQAGPVHTLTEAALHLDAQHTFLFLRGGTQCTDDASRQGHTIVGGLVVDATSGTWSRSPGAQKTELDSGVDVVVTGEVAVDGIDIGPGANTNFFVIDHAVIARTQLDRPVVVVGDGIFVDDTSTVSFGIGTGASARFLRSTATSLGVDGSVFVFRSNIASFDDEGDADIVSSALITQPTDGNPAIVASTARSLRMWHDTVARSAFGAFPLVDVLSVQTVVVAAASFVDRGDQPTLSVAVASGGSALLDRAAFGRQNAGSPPPLLAVIDGQNLADANALNTIADPLVSTNDCSQFDPIPFDDLLHESPQSPLRNASVPVFLDSAPSSVLIDIDGDCRYADGSADIGADELTP
jgi:hypothetical protein